MSGSSKAASRVTVSRARFFGLLLVVAAMVIVLPNLAMAVTPLPPTGLVVTNPGTGGTLDLAWNAHADGPPTGYYSVYRSTGGIWSQIATSITATSYPNSGLVNGVTYYYAVTVTNNLGEESGMSVSQSGTPTDITPPVTSDTTVPPTPNGSNGWYITQPDVGLWMNEPGFTQYRWNANPYATYSTTLTAITGDNNLWFYSYDVATPPNTETAQSRTFKVDITNPLTDTASAAAKAGGAIDISWIRGSDPESGVNTLPWANWSYQVDEDTDPALGSPTPVAFYSGWGAGPPITYTRSGAFLIDGTTYYYRVIVQNTAGRTSNYDLASAVSDATPPTTPTATSATAMPAGVIRVGWGASTDSGSGMKQYHVKRGAAPGGPYGTSWTVPTGTTTLDDTTTVDGTTYYYVVDAEDIAGNVSGNSVEASAKADATAPSTTSRMTGGTLGVNSVTGTTDWYTASGTGEVSTDDTGTITWNWNGTANATINPANTGTWYGAPGSMPNEGVNALNFFGVDNAGNVETPVNSDAYKLDTQDPIPPTGLVPTSGPGGFVTFTWTDDGTDPVPGSGKHHYNWYHRPSGGAWIGPVDVLGTYTDTTYVGLDGPWEFMVKTEDGAGHVSPTSAIVGYVVDSAKPTTDVTIAAGPDGAGGWYRTTPTVSLSIDETGTIGWDWTGGFSNVINPAYPPLTSWNPIGGFGNGSPVQGVNTLTWRGTDVVGNVEVTRTASWSYDSMPPEVLNPVPANGYVINHRRPTMSADVSDTASGYGDSEMWVDSMDVSALVTEPTVGTTYGTVRYLPTFDMIEGEHTVRVRAWDQAGNGPTAWYTWIFKIDVTPPQGLTEVINSGDTYTTSETITLSLYAYDNISSVGQMQFSNDGASWSGWETYDTTKPAWNMVAGNGGVDADGTKTVHYRVRDISNLQNVSAAITDTIILDRAAPTITSFAINGGDPYTNATNVDLATSAGGSPTEMMISNDAGFGGASWESFAASKAWSIPSGDGAKTVYIKLKDAAGNVSTTSSDDITLDTVVPADPSVSINSGAAWSTSGTVDLALGATGSPSEMMVSNDAGFAGAGWESYGTSKSSWALTAGDGVRTVYAKFRDAAGNVSAVVSDDIQVDTAAPTSPTISINGGAAYSSSATVDLALSAIGATEMMVSNDSGFAGASWEAYATSKTGWVLTAGDGAKTVYVQYRDAAGNVSSTASDGITLDTVDPAGTVTIDAGATYATNANVPLALTASADTAMMMISNDAAFTGASWQPYGATVPVWTLPAPDGTKTVYVKFKDFADRESLVVTDTIILDTTAPRINYLTDTPDPVRPRVGQKTKFSFNLSEAGTITVWVRSGSTGHLVRTITKVKPAGWNKTYWDGRNAGGSLVPAGTYKYKMKVKDAAGWYTISSYHSIRVIR